MALLKREGSVPAVSSIKWTWLSRLNQALFLLFVAFTMLSYSQNLDQGPFSWWAFPLPTALAGAGWRIGPLSLLPLLLAAGLGLDWTVNRPDRRWSWGDKRVFWPLLAITLLALVHVLLWGHFTIAVALALFWLVYLFELNGRGLRLKGQLLGPAHIWLFVLVVLIQSLVGIGQFVSQREVGLSWLGEPALDPYEPGISIVVKGSARWLRAYGLNSHPNRLGLKLVVFMLLLWPFLEQGSARRRRSVWLALVMGFAGLLVTLSRSAWVGLAAGLAAYGWSWLNSVYRSRRLSISSARISLAVALLAVALGFVVTYGDTLIGRVSRPANEVEERSVNDRLRETQVALQLLVENPWYGVGLGNSSTAFRAVDPFVGPVHIVPLLVGVELGLPGMLLWLLFQLAPLTRPGLWRRYTLQAAVWLGIFCFSLLQLEPTMFKLNIAVLLGMVAPLWAIPTLSPSSGSLSQ